MCRDRGERANTTTRFSRTMEEGPGRAARAQSFYDGTNKFGSAKIIAESLFPGDNDTL